MLSWSNSHFNFFLDCTTQFVSLIVPLHLDSCHIRYRRSTTISHVRMYDIIGPVLDVVYHIVYTISYIRYCFHEHTILDVLYRIFIRYRMSTYDIVYMTYDIVLRQENISCTISYLSKYSRCCMSVMYDIVCAYRMQYHMSYTISYIYVQYHMLTYDIVSQFDHRILVTTSYVYIQCRMLYKRHCMSVLKAPSIDFKFSKD